MGQWLTAGRSGMDRARGASLAGRLGVAWPLWRRPRFERRCFDGSTGSRDYRLYVPATPPRGPRSLLVMLHGCTQTAEDFALATGMNLLAERHGLVVAYPEQTGAHHRKACWNWYRPGDQRRGAGEPAILAEMTRALAAEFGIGTDRIFVAGLSAGGAMAAVMGETYPDLFAAVGVHSGVACGVAINLPSALGAMRGWPALFQRAATGQAPRRTIVLHGMADRAVHPANAGRIVAAAASGVEAELRQEAGTSAGGRPYTVTVATAGEGPALSELWLIEGTGHAWSGGQPGCAYTDPAGPNASAEMVRFFLQGSRPGAH